MAQHELTVEPFDVPQRMTSGSMLASAMGPDE
jgi:hypothetical protein